MRQFPIVLCVSVLCGGYASVSAASPLVFSLDLTAPCNGSGCSGTHPTDMGFVLGATAFSYSSSNGAFVSTLALSAPVVCDEVANGGALGPVTTQRLAPSFNNADYNAGKGGVLEFGAGGPSVIDVAAVSYDGSSPAGVAASYSNYGATLPPQVACYQINPVTGGPQAYAAGPSGIFAGGFEDHQASEPWLTAQTIVSPRANASKKLIDAPAQGANSQISGVTPPDTLGYVVEIHNASAAVGWHLVAGYDYAFFDPSVTSRHATTLWCVLGNAIPQPGSINGSPASCGSAASSHVFTNADIQSGTNSIFVYIEYEASDAAINNWNTLSGTLYPAVAAIFPPFGTYPQRFDDKVAVAHANNLPTPNIARIVCNNDTTSTSCAIYDQAGHALPAALTFKNVIASGAAQIDPISYFVDPFSNSTLPGNANSDVLAVSNVACIDPSGILAGGIGNGNFATSTVAKGGSALSFTFAPSGGVFVSGTATCTATFTASGFAPTLSRVHVFTITMQQATATHFAVTAPASATAGTAFNTLTVSALDGGNNVVGTYNGTVHFTSSDFQALLPANATLTNGTGTFSTTLKTTGSKTVTATDTVNGSMTGTSGAIAVAPAAASHFSVNAPASAATGTAFAISVTAQDAYGNTDTNYAGIVHFTSTDATATLPTDATLTFGSGTPSITLNTVGMWTVTAADTVTASIAGASGTINAR